ncbi:MAG: hypothetical protein JSR51_00860 [Proteobacteria bacterium]|nr:hypothetical protein [Pseudomonadota bacterium]
MTATRPPNSLWLQMTAHRRLSFIRELHDANHAQLIADKESHDYRFGHSYNRSLANVNHESAFLLAYGYIEHLLVEIASGLGHQFKPKESKFDSSLRFITRMPSARESPLKTFIPRFDCYRKIRNSVAHGYGAVKDQKHVEEAIMCGVPINAANGEYLLDQEFMKTLFSDSDNLIQSVIDVL